MKNRITPKPILIDLISFIKHPDDRQIKIPFGKRMFLLATLLLLEIAIAIVIVYPVYEITDFLINLKSNPFHWLDKTLLNIFILAVILAPVLEEVIFRYFLRQSKWGKIFANSNIWNKIFPYFIYLSAISFGIVHLSNFQNDSLAFFLLAPIIVLSQLSGGFILAFIRVRINFFHSLLYHAFWNFLFAIAVPLIVAVMDKPYIDINNRYKLQITEQPFFKEERDFFLYIKKITWSIKLKQSNCTYNQSLTVYIAKEHIM